MGRGVRWQTLIVAAVATVATLWSSAAMATITQGDFSVFGFFETREDGRWGEGSSNNNGTPTTLTHPTPTTTLAVPGTAATVNGGSFDFNHWDLDEARQLADIRPDYHFVKNYKFLGRFDTLLLKDADFFAFYRPWYDAFGTLKRTGRAETNRDWTRYSQDDLQQQYFRDDLHEYYAQLNFTDNFSARVGKQEVIWSEADALSGTEITNSVDATYHGVYGAEAAEDLRKNLRMIKLNYILPDFMKTANNEIEAFVIPGDFQGTSINVNTTDARNPWIIPAATGKTGFNQNGQPFRNQTFMDAGGKPMLYSGGLFFDDVTQSRANTPSNSLNNSEFGVRLSSLLPIGNGLQASFIYLYEARDMATGLCSQCTGASAGPGFTQAAPGVFTNLGRFAYGPPRPGVPKAGTIKILTTADYKRKNFFGLTGTYYDKDLTDIVYRYDTLYAPSVGVGTATPAGGANGPGSGIEDTEQARFIIAGDRPTYIPWISKQHTFLTFQYVNTWYPDRPNNAVPSIANTLGKVREDSNFAFLAATNWLMNGQLTATNVFQWDIDDNCGAFTTTNIYRYSRNVLFGVNSAWFLGRSGRYTDPFLYSRSQRESLLEFTMSYEI
ncbi:MAG: hypothetical protein ACREQR_13360 [Candidatus Binataceae bacterium]